MERLKHICERRLIDVTDFETNPLNIFASHESAGIVDGSMATKMTVQVITYDDDHNDDDGMSDIQSTVCTW